MNITEAVDMISEVVECAKPYSGGNINGHLMTCLYCHSRIVTVWEDDTIGNKCLDCGGEMKQRAQCQQCGTIYPFAHIEPEKIADMIKGGYLHTDSAEEKHEHELAIDDTGATICTKCDA